MAENKSGVDSLIDALRASGANVDEKMGGNQASSQANSSSTKSSSSSKSSGSGANYTGGLGDIPKAILDLPFMDRFKNMNKKGKIITTIVIICLLGIAY